ncbi:sulfate adenylyltransferase subunit CysN [Shewanella cyperi]|uniref:Sulfate adenylyltransferase subunit 1 n=1 Tax=Shewanella cyperi TaxID=2814292 RepID=A0A974XNR5_9GAMM|nr:sulfate adenylyltransferase subunit CysN [Shewanella cyperi]QSX30643.1 sulfate adenylyltransferase subunit CysN [Shewanella cyperi]
MSVALQVKDLGIEQYLEKQQHKSLLKFLTCGSVDDGKSTLIGRLLHDSAQIYEDQLAALHKDSKSHGTTGEAIDLALLVDGLQAEREQGITIDVAYRYFSTEKRKFIIADTPGHEQYTRNMATGASNCDLAIILIDARHGVQVQTRRHSFICALLGIKQFVVAVNKMDLLGFDEARFEEIKRDYLAFAAQLQVPDIRFVPLSALEGDNLVNRSERSPWYQGPTLLELLEQAPVTGFNHGFEARLPVQYVNRPNLDFRGFAGTIASGSFRTGDEVKVLPSGKSSRIKSIVTFDGELPEAFAGQAVTLTLNDEIDISRGDVIVPADSRATVSNRLLAKVVWMHEQPLVVGRQYNIKLGTKKVPGTVKHIVHGIDVNSLAETSLSELLLNGIALVELELNESVVFDAYRDNRDTGGFIFIDRLSNITVGAGMVESALEAKAQKTDFSEFELELNALIRKHFPHWQALDISK